MTDSTERVCLWSGPRNVSTALMYSFSQRSDTKVVDEPLYAHFLRVSGATHPLREACLAAQDSDGDRVARELILGPWDSPVVFFKQMAHHLVDLDLDFMRHTHNVFLTRDPLQVLPSLLLRIGQPRMRDTGFARQCELVEMLESWGQTPVVLDSGDLLMDPPGMLAALCEHLKLPFEEEMLRWPQGPKEFDGIWASEWYKNVHQTTEFRPHRPKPGPFPSELRALLEDCLPYYAKLQVRALRS